MGNSLQHGALYRFFTYGTYLTLGAMRANQSASECLDFIGLNYYSNGFMRGFKKSPEERPEYKTDNDTYRIYPEGMYRAIIELWENLAKPIKKNGKSTPIYVTENGIATSDNAKRSAWYTKYVQAIACAAEDIAKEGGQVLGYFPWTLCSNYEWPKLQGPAVHREYGLFDVDAKRPERLTMKTGARSYFDIVSAFHSA